MECLFVGNVLRIICLVATGALFLRGGWKYFEDESSSLVDYRAFQNTIRDIYPTISLCFYNSKDNLGMYDSTKLNSTYEIKDPGEYTKFLSGDLSDDSMVGVRYDDVTTDIKDRVESVKVIGNREQELYKWVMNDNNTNSTAKGWDFISKSNHSFPFYTSYRHAYVKCFSIDLSAKRLPNIDGQLINAILINFKHIRIADVTLIYIISYPGQILRGFVLDAEYAWNHRITTGYLKTKLFLIDIIEVFRRRKTFHKPCNENFKEDDNMILNEVAKIANCKPPHWNISEDYPICKGKEKMKRVFIPGSYNKIASSSFLQKFVQPCDGILAATFNTISEQRGLSLGGLISTESVNSATVGFLFKNEEYKEIKYTRAFNIESLIGNVGGYIGLFLGFAIWQLPDTIEFIAKKCSALFGGKIYRKL